MINFVSFPYKKTCQVKKQTNRFNFPLQKDTVSFTGAKSKTSDGPSSVRIDEAIKLTKRLNKLYRSNQLTFENIETHLNYINPIPTSVKSMSELPIEVPKNTVAYMMPVYNSNLELQSATIYLNQECFDKKYVALLISNCAHENTHILQHTQNNDYLGFKKYTDDLEEARFMNAISATALNYIQESILPKFFGNKDFINIARNCSKTHKELTKEKVRHLFLNEEELTKLVESCYKRAFYTVIKNYSIDFESKEKEAEAMCKKPVTEALLRRFEMESEAKGANIASLRNGVDINREMIEDANHMKIFYDLFLDVYKK